MEKIRRRNRLPVRTEGLRGDTTRCDFGSVCPCLGFGYLEKNLSGPTVHILQSDEGRNHGSAERAGVSAGYLADFLRIRQTQAG